MRASGCFLSLWLAIALSAAARAEDSAASAPSAEQIAALIDQLDADTFAVRETATAQLIAAGGAVIEPLAASLASATLESSNRSLHILRELACQDDPETAEAARSALTRAAAPRITSTARRASAALAAVDDIRRERAVRAMEKLGAAFENEDRRVGQIPIKADMRSLAIGPAWTGAAADWRHLEALNDVERITLEGEKIDDEVLKQVASMANLLVVSIKRANITEKGIAELARLPKLQQLEIMYSPVGDGAIEELALLKSTPWFRLFGAKITSEGADRLRQALPAATIDHRLGAFLGVGCGPHPLGCEITQVHPGSAADDGGLLVGDVILKYDGHEIPDFETLTKHIADNAANDTVAVEILRDDERLERKVKLDEWP
jgi:hypothetical protein